MAFADSAELLAFARRFLADRLGSLRQDVRTCLAARPAAAFPALLYCFATVDLLGAVVAGEAAREVPVTGKPGRTRPTRTAANASAYMRAFMGYLPEQAEVLQNLYRHKMVHLAQPAAVVIDQKGRRISWAYQHRWVLPGPSDVPRNPAHLTLQAVPGSHINVTEGWSVPCDHLLWLDIGDFVGDVVSSVERDGTGYVARLEADAELQTKFRRAIEQIYEATPVR